MNSKVSNSVEKKKAGRLFDIAARILTTSGTSLEKKEDYARTHTHKRITAKLLRMMKWKKNRVNNFLFYDFLEREEGWGEPWDVESKDGC